MYAIEKLFYKQLLFEEGYEVWTASPAVDVSMESINEDFPSRVVEKLGRQKFPQKIDAKEEYQQCAKQLTPYFKKELKRFSKTLFRSKPQAQTNQTLATWYFSRIKYSEYIVRNRSIGLKTCFANCYFQTLQYEVQIRTVLGVVHN